MTTMLRSNLALVLLACWAAPAAAQKIAVVNIPECSDKYEQRDVLEAGFEKEQRDLIASRNAAEAGLNAELEELNRNFRRESPEFQDREREIAMKKTQAEFDLERKRKSIEARMASSLRRIYDDIALAVKEVAEAKGYDLVIAVEQLPEQAAETPAMVRQQIVLQKAVYWDKNIDITQDVIARLTEMFKASQEAPKPTAEKPADAAAAPADPAKPKG